MSNNECETCKQVKNGLQAWLDTQGHDRCWWHPEILQELATIFGLQATEAVQLPPRAEFRSFCHLYEEEQYKCPPK